MIESAILGELFDGKGRTVNASFLQDLLLDKLPEADVHPLGPRAKNLRIEGDLNISGQTLKCPIVFRHCVFEEELKAEGLICREFDLRGSTLKKGLDAPALQVSESLLLAAGDSDENASDVRPFVSMAKISLLDANVKGVVSLKGACLKLSKEDQSRQCLVADRIHVEGSVFLNAFFDETGKFHNERPRFSAFGAVFFRNAKIGGNVHCDGGHFAADFDPETKDEKGLCTAQAGAPEVPKCEAPGYWITLWRMIRALAMRPRKRQEPVSADVPEPPTALNFSGSKIEGSLRLCAFTVKQREVASAFQAHGVVNLSHVHIKNDLDLSGAIFDLRGHEGLKMRATRIDGRAAVRFGTKINTNADLRGCRLEVYYQTASRDDITKHSSLPDFVRLNGLYVERLDIRSEHSDAPRNPAPILNALLESSARYGFEPSVHERFVLLLRSCGYPADANSLAVKLQRENRQKSWRATASTIETIIRRDGILEANSNYKSGLELWLGAVIRFCGAFVRDLISRIFDLTMGFGYRWFNFVVMLAFVIGLGTCVSDRAYDAGLIVPNDPFVIRSETWRNCVAEEIMVDDKAARVSATHCYTGELRGAQAVELALANNGSKTSGHDAIPLGEDYLRFDPLLYTLDVFVPLVSLGQERAWRPSTASRSTARQQFSIRAVGLLGLFGWVSTIILAAGLANVFRK